MQCLPALRQAAFASGDTLPPREGEQGYLGENQPTFHGYNSWDVLNWSPETDEYAEFMKSNVPLQERNKAFSATHTNPLLDQKVEHMSLMRDYNNEFFNGMQYNDQFAWYLFNFWQYQDYQASWHGMVTNPTPDDLYNPENPWNNRPWEFGVLNIPNPATTNAAHKNGVQSLGCLFFPRKEFTDDWVYVDENGRYPLADKLVEMANWFGFDGYFINAEVAVDPSFLPTYQGFCRALTSQGMYVNTYAAIKYGPEVAESSWGGIDYYQQSAGRFSHWVKKPEDKTIASNSLYMNPDSKKEMVDGSVKAMEALGLDPKATVFHTLEASQTDFSGTRGALFNLFDENGVPRTGISELDAGVVYAGLDEILFDNNGDNGNGNYNYNKRQDPDYQKYVFARERSWWTGSEGPYYTPESRKVVKGITFLDKAITEYTQDERNQLLDAILNADCDPSKTANNPRRMEQTGDEDWDKGYPYSSYPGMAAFISERSVIKGTNFFTNFNTGHGMEYYIDGKVSNKNQWSNINDQDILPTWQWWTETKSGEKSTLNLDFDYGAKYSAAFDNAQLGAYNGGSSLAIFGDVTEETKIHLYKTELEVLSSSKFELTYNKPSKTDKSELSLVLYLKDGNGVKEVCLPISGANKQTKGWITTKIDLGKYKGETIAAFGIAVNTTGKAIEDYQINLGGVSITDNRSSAPKAPSGFQIDRAFETGEVYLSWNLADYNDVREYNVWAVDAKGNRTHLGATYDDIFYVKNTIYNADSTVAFELTAQGADGKNSNLASVPYDFAVVRNVTTKAVSGAVKVAWTGSAAKKCESIRVEVSLPDNYYGNTKVYTATVGAKKTAATVKVPVNDGSNYIARVSYLDKKDNVLGYLDASGQLIDDHCDPYQGGLLPRTEKTSGYKLVSPQVYDWWKIWVWNARGDLVKDGQIRGNGDLALSKPGEFVDVQLMDFAGNMSKVVRVYSEEALTKGVEESFSDPAVLAAVKAQIGDKFADVVAFDGILDLSNTDVVDARELRKIQNMNTLNLTGCAKLEWLDVSGTNLKHIVCEDPKALTELLQANFNGCCLDLSEGTAEREFVDAVAAMFQAKGETKTVDPDLSNLAAKGTPDGYAKLFDGNTGNYEYIGESGEVGTVVLDMGAEVEIFGCKNTTYSSAYYPEKWTLSVSDNGAAWTEVYSAESNFDAELMFDESVSGRYFRFEVVAGYSGNGTYIKEFELFGHDMITVTPSVTADNQR